MKITKDTKMEFDELSRNVIGCADRGSRNLGPGLLESTYRPRLACELSHSGIRFHMELPTACSLQRHGAGPKCYFRFIRRRFLPTCDSPKFRLGCLSISTLQNCRTTSNVRPVKVFVLFVSFAADYFVTGPSGRMTLPKTSLSTWARPA